MALAVFTFGCGRRDRQSLNSVQDSTGRNDKAAFQSGHLPVNGIKMYYQIHGSGKPIVLIHGGGSTLETTFGRVIPLLSRHRKVIAVDLQAHGRTTDRNQDESLRIEGRLFEGHAWYDGFAYHA